MTINIVHFVAFRDDAASHEVVPNDVAHAAVDRLYWLSAILTVKMFVDTNYSIKYFDFFPVRAMV